MANLYSVLPGIQPSAQEIAQAELLAKQILEAQFPDMDLREGTGLRDLVLRPSAMLLALTRKGLDYYFAQNTISGVTNDTPTDIVDSIMSTWFINRNLGTRAVISARLYFARRKNVSLTSDIFFSPDNISKFFPTQSATYSADSMGFDSFQNEYFIDIDLTAEAEGTQYNIGQGSLLYFSNFDPYFLHAEVNYLKDSSVSSESNSEFVDRAKTAISTRNLINNPSIDSNLKEQFNYLKNIVSIGMGDPEMIRDQIQAVFTAQLPKLLTNLTSSGVTATATLADHGYNSGQTVIITGAIPSVYNGNYIINVIDPSTFTYTLPTSSTSVTVMPSVQAVNAPLLIHNGGMVDVYCGDSLSTSVVQLTTDEFGKAQLTGAVYEFSRSDVSGGSDDDTIPFYADVVASGTTVHAADKYVEVASIGHGLATGDVVTVSGLTQTIAIQSISCSGVTVTVQANSHGLVTGNSVLVQNVTPTQYNGTYTITVVDANTFVYFVSFNIASAGSGSTMQIFNPLLTGEFTVTVTGANNFNIGMPGLWTNGTTVNAILIQHPVTYTVTNSFLQEQKVEQITCAGTVVTVTIANHGITANRYVTISGATPSTYNGTWLVSTMLNKDQFQFIVPTNIPSAGTGSIVCSSVIPWYDYGFSSRQDLTIDFGPTYANSTASFEISYFDNIDSIQNYLEDSNYRVLCGDLVAKGFNFYTLDVSVTAYNGQTPDTQTVTDSVNTYLANLLPGDIFVMSEIVAQLSADGITNIKTPVQVTYTKYTRDLIPPVTGTITDYLDPNDRTNIFVLNSVTTNNENI
ncbi:hypothetical protein D3C87_460080 [compost metagenome]